MSDKVTLTCEITGSRYAPARDIFPHYLDLTRSPPKSIVIQDPAFPFGIASRSPDGIGIHVTDQGELRLSFRNTSSGVLFERLIPKDSEQGDRFYRAAKYYFLMTDSYGVALNEGRQARIEALSLGVRGVEDDGVVALKELLEDRVTFNDQGFNRPSNSLFHLSAHALKHAQKLER